MERRYHIDESETDTLLGSKVLWQVEEVKLICKLLVYNF